MQFPNAKKRDEIIKSNIIDSFQYGDNKIFLKKSGKQIKQRLQENVADIKVEISRFTTQLEQKIAQCGQKPTESIPTYWLEPYDDRMSLTIAIYGKSSEVIADSESISSLPTQQDKQQTQCMREHDQIVRRIIDRQKQLIELDTLIRGINDSKSYQLTIRQATVLGL